MKDGIEGENRGAQSRVQVKGGQPATRILTAMPVPTAAFAVVQKASWAQHIIP